MRASSSCLIALLGALVLLGGCASTPQNVEMDEALLSNQRCQLEKQEAPAPEEPKATLLQLNPVPTWTWSGIWTGNDELTLVDMTKEGDRTRSDLVAYDVATGERVLDSMIPWASPSGVHKDANGSVVVNDKCDIWYPEGISWPPFLEYNEADSRHYPLEGLIREEFACHWTAPIDPMQILVFGDMRLEGGDRNDTSKWKTGVFLVYLGGWKLVEDIPLQGSWRRFHLAGYPYMAARTYGRGYYVKMSNPPKLVEVYIWKGAVHREEIDLPNLRVDLPNLDPYRSMSQWPELYGKLAQMSGPVGLYSNEQHTSIFLMWREVSAEGPTYTVWKLEDKDDCDGQYGWRWRQVYKLPYAAQHVTAVPGPKWWAFFLRGKVSGFANAEDLGKVFLVPTESVEDNRWMIDCSTGKPIE